jgi:hypothetical protein
VFASTVSWNGLTDVPAGFSDGTDDAAPSDWNDLTGVPSGFADGVDDEGGAPFLGNSADTAFAPSFTWSIDQNTGLFRSGVDELALATAGVERFNITAQGNVSIGIAGGSNDGSLHVQNSSMASRPIKCDRVGSDGQLLAWARDDTVRGDVTIAGSTVSYNAFTGSHYAWTDTPLERGTLVTLTGLNRQPEVDGEVVYGVAPTTRANDPACLGAYLAPHLTGESAQRPDQHQIMSVGNGEMWVSESAAGDIHPGDLLISSDMSGCAMKDDPVRFPLGYICARAAESLDWDTVTAHPDGHKRARISVLFECFVRDSRGAATQERMHRLELENADLRKELNQLNGLVEALNQKLTRGMQ